MLSGFAHSPTPNSQFVKFSDSFSVRIRMSGRGFKDLIQNHPHVFEVSLPDDVFLPNVLGTAAEPDYPPSNWLIPPRWKGRVHRGQRRPGEPPDAACRH